MKKILFLIAFLFLCKPTFGANFQIFANQTTNANSLAFVATGNINPGLALNTLITIYGVFDGATAQLQFQAADSNWYSTNDSPFTTSGAYFAQLNSNIPYRLSLSGSNTSTQISATVYNAVSSN